MPASDPPPALRGVGRPPAAAPPRPHSAPLDAAGAAVACACAAHCLLLPAAVAVLPALGLGRLLGEEVEWALLAATFVIGAWSLGPAGPGAGRAARGALPLWLFVGGAGVLLGTRLGVLGDGVEGGAPERALVLAGAALVAAAHVTSWRRGRRCAARTAALLVLLATAAPRPLTAQQVAPGSAPATGVVRGAVTRAEDGQPLEGARVRVGGADDAAAGGREVATGADGRFLVSGVPAGRVRLTVRWGALPERTLDLAARAGDTLQVFVRLAAQVARLDGVVVTARERRGGAEGGTVSTVSRAAIEHLQASSVADVLQLVPGQLAANPTLDGARQAVLRAALPPSGDVSAAAADAARATALGTAVIVDGVPLSNNANLQTSTTILNSGPSTLPAFSSTANRGVDLRLLPADNVERVEVVRGVPSARHGDLTAGAVFVTSRAGARAPEFRARANPTLFEASAVAGWGGALRGALPGPLGAPARAAAERGVNLDANVVASQDDPRAPEGRFTRATGQLAATRDGARLSQTLRARLWTTLDEQRRSPDDTRTLAARSSRDQGARVDLRGAWRPFAAAEAGAADPGGLGPRLEWTASGSWAWQDASLQELVTRDIYPVTNATTDTMVAAPFGRSEYLSRLRVRGRPVNGYARLEALHALGGTGLAEAGGARHHLAHQLALGGEWRLDANAGAGRQFDATEPPRLNYLAGDRPRRFDEVPAVAQLAVYAEDRLRATLLGRAAELQAGVRVDRLGGRGGGFGAPRFGTVAAPRVNAAWSLLPAASRTLLRARAGYGVAAKAPTLAQLYPGPRYFDLVNLNYFAQNPAERLALVTTRVVTPGADGLRAARAAKREAGVEAGWGDAFLSVVAFDERTTGAFGTTRVPIVLPVARYRVAATPAGRPPEVEAAPYAVDTLLSAYDVPRNTRAIRTRGVEAALDLPEWAAVRTALNLTAAYTATRSTDRGLDVDASRVLGASAPARLGVFPGGGGAVARQLVTAARLVHRAPAAGLVASLLVQTLWADDDRPLGRDFQLGGYFDRAGRVVALTPEQAASPEYASLRRPAPPNALVWERRPPLTLVNLRVTKALPLGAQLAFYANNALADRPLYRPRRAFADGQSRAAEQRNPPLFFGVELVAAPFR